MALLNHTTTISVDKTLGEIHRILSGHGARQIITDYDADGNPSAIAFTIATPIGPKEFRLPANLDGIWRVLTDQYNDGRVQRRFTTREQAARVGWRIVKDWLQAQIAIIEAGMASMDEILLPYMLAPTGRTVYEEYLDSRLLLPSAQEG